MQALHAESSIVLSELLRMANKTYSIMLGIGFTCESRNTTTTVITKYFDGIYNITESQFSSVFFQFDILCMTYDKAQFTRCPTEG